MGKKVLTAYERVYRDGKLSGKLEGEISGESRKALETARRMRDYGVSLEKIIFITG